MKQDHLAKISGGARNWTAAVRRLTLHLARSRASLAAGGLAYFVALSIAPAVIAMGSLAGLVLEPADLRTSLLDLAARTPGTDENARAAIDVLVDLVESSSASAFSVATAVGILLAAYGASKVVLSMRMAMNTIFDVEETRSSLFEKVVSTVATLVALLLAVAVVVLVTVVPRILASWDITGVTTSTGIAALDWAIMLAIAYVTIRWIIRHAPDEVQPVGWLSPGVLFALVWIAAATVGVGLYVQLSSSLGAAVVVLGSAVVVLLWLYLCFLGLLWGAAIEALTHSDSPRPRVQAGALSSESLP